MTGGRPLRFLVLSLGGWVLIRIAMLLPAIDALPASHTLPRLIEAVIPGGKTTMMFLQDRSSPPADLPHDASDTYGRSGPPVSLGPHISSEPKPTVERQPFAPPRIAATPALAAASKDTTRAFTPRTERMPSPIAPPVMVSAPGRLSGSAWLLARGGPAGTVSGGQLGASQAGLRLVYALGERRRFSVVARLATPLEGAGREAALGIEWQPTRLPVRLVAEHRFALDGGRGGPTLGVIAGYGPADIAPGLRLEGYGQAGVIVRDGVEGFVDASARVTHPIGRVAGARLDIGVGAWGSAQRAAERFDLGPSIVATVPVARKTLRLTLDWRERVAGAARPGSGPALSIGSDF